MEIMEECFSLLLKRGREHDLKWEQIPIQIFDLVRKSQSKPLHLKYRAVASMHGATACDYFFLSTLSSFKPCTTKYTTAAITRKSISTLKKLPNMTLAPKMGRYAAFKPLVLPKTRPRTGLIRSVTRVMLQLLQLLLQGQTRQQAQPHFVRE